MHVPSRQRRGASNGLNSLSAAFETELSHMRDRLEGCYGDDFRAAPSGDDMAMLAGRFPRFGRLAGLLRAIAEDRP
jgi:hypothetical protein